MFMQYKLSLSFLLLLSVIQAGAQVIVKDKNTNDPLAGVSIMKDHGEYIGYTDEHGLLPDLHGASSIRLTCLGYEAMDVAVKGISNELLLTPVSYPLSDVVVKKPDAKRLKLNCYYRQYILSSEPVKALNSSAAHDLYMLDGIANIYIPYHDNSAAALPMMKGLGCRLEYGDKIESSHYRMDLALDFSFNTMLDRIKNEENYSIEREGSVIRAYSKKKHPYYKDIIIRIDSVAGLIHVRYSKDDGVKGKILLPDESGVPQMEKARAQDGIMHYIYRFTPGKKITAADMVAYSKTTIILKRDTSDTFHIMDVQEFYPVSAEYLTKEEYKAEKKQDMPVTTSDIDEYKNKALVQELAPEVKERIEKKGRKE